MAQTVGPDLTRDLSKFYSELSYEDLSPETVDSAKYFCLDYLAMALRGAVSDSSEVMQRGVDILSGPGNGVVAGTSKKVLPQYAALANGCAAHSLEMDDTANDASMHPGAVAYPAAFACGDMTPVSGRDLITAVTAGYDLMVRLGHALDPRKHYGRGFHPTGTCGTFGAALIGAHLYKLDALHTAWSMGIAGSQAAGSHQYLADGAWTKRMHPGWAAHNGVVAATLAKEGYTGPMEIIEGKSGFLHAYSDDVDHNDVSDGLGDWYYIDKTSIKPHSCCRYNQGPIDCILELVADHGLTTSDVDKIRVGMLEAGMDIVANPVDYKKNPKTLVDAQFSMPFSAAVALTHGKVSLNEYTQEMLDDQGIKDLMSRTECVEDPALEVDYPSKWPSWVEIDTKDGRTVRSDVEYPKGDPQNPLSWDELKDKFRTLTQTVISSERQEEIIKVVESLESVDDIRVLSNLTSV
jgi:2-methylcitrate dehydratase PrpD